MIIRLFDYAVRDGGVSEFEALTRERGLAALPRQPGFLFAYAGRSYEDPDAGVVVTGWETYEDLYAVVGEQIDRPRFNPDALALATWCEATHWEAVDMPSLGAEAQPSVLRVFRGDVVPGSEAAYFDHLRRSVWDALRTTPGIAGWWVGRQSDAAGTEPLLSVSTWTSPQALAAATGPTIDPAFRAYRDTLFHERCVQDFELFATAHALRQMVAAR